MYDLVLVCEDMFGMDILSAAEYKIVSDEANNVEPEFRIKGVICPEQLAGRQELSRYRYLGTLEDCLPSDDEKYLIGIKIPDHKKKAVELLRAKGARFATLWAAWVLGSREDVSCGEGCVIAAHCIKENAQVGSFVTIFNSMVSDAAIGDYATLMSYANITDAKIGSGAFVDDNAMIMTKLTIGDNAVVGPGSMVIKDVKPGSHVFGVPAKKEKKL